MKIVYACSASLEFVATNITNEKYYTFSGGGWQSTGVEYASLGMPRMYGLRLKYRFGGMAD